MPSPSFLLHGDTNLFNPIGREGDHRFVPCGALYRLNHDRSLGLPAFDSEQVAPC